MQLNGTLDTFKSLTNLNVLDLSDNAFEGEIPSSWSALSKLQALSLSRNQLVGSIPGFLGDFPDLRYLMLDSNSFQGPLPPSIVAKNFTQLLLRDLTPSNNSTLGSHGGSTPMAIITGVSFSVVLIAAGILIFFTIYKRKKNAKLAKEEEAKNDIAYVEVPDIFAPSIPENEINSTDPAPSPSATTQLISPPTEFKEGSLFTPARFVSPITWDDSAGDGGARVSGATAAGGFVGFEIPRDEKTRDPSAFVSSGPVLTAEDAQRKLANEMGRFGASEQSVQTTIATYIHDFGLSVAWNVDQVCEWLSVNGFEDDDINYFRQAEVTGEILHGMNMESLKEIGITSLRTRTKILNKIAALRPQVAPGSSRTDADGGITPPQYGE
ncbi:hypothetical protein HDU76_013016 [Blyttiomyces sp. JEL0837]|nr:hypothetical protein HDU76_013016 [Blyttiomyces sp. JEL0837]